MNGEWGLKYQHLSVNKTEESVLHSELEVIVRNINTKKKSWVMEKIMKSATRQVWTEDG